MLFSPIDQWAVKLMKSHCYNTPISNTKKLNAFMYVNRNKTTLT